MIAENASKNVEQDKRLDARVKKDVEQDKELKKQQKIDKQHDEQLQKLQKLTMLGIGLALCALIIAIIALVR